ncbi:MAG: hypothetical protein ACLR93_05215 [Alistipes onderdonkii]
MIKSFLSWGTALLVLCSGLLSSCDDKNEGGGNPDPTVTIAIGDAAFNALKFTLTLKDADNCSYICAKASETVPTAEQILANGQSVTASGVIEVGNLEPNTAYRLSAVAQKGNISGKVYSIEHTTSAPGVQPAVVLTPGQSTPTTLTFNATLTDRETAAYVCLERQRLTLPRPRRSCATAKPSHRRATSLSKPEALHHVCHCGGRRQHRDLLGSQQHRDGNRTLTPVVTLAAGAPA